MALAGNIYATLGTLSTFSFNPVFQLSTAKNEINLFNNHVLIVAPVTFAAAGATTPSAELLFLTAFAFFSLVFFTSVARVFCNEYFLSDDCGCLSSRAGQPIPLIMVCMLLFCFYFFSDFVRCLRCHVLRNMMVDVNSVRMLNTSQHLQFNRFLLALEFCANYENCFIHAQIWHIETSTVTVIFRHIVLGHCQPNNQIYNSQDKHQRV